MKNFRIIYLYFVLIPLIGCNNKSKANLIIYNGTFEGTEPFWSFDIMDNKYIMNCNNNEVEGIMEFSMVSERGTSIAFIDKQNNVYGIINKSNNNCDLAISDIDSLEYEIYFNYNKITYKGCGSIK